MGKIALFPGTFDPPTLGHLNLFQRALQLFDHLIIAVARKTHKNPLFSPEERADMLEKIVPQAEIMIYSGLIVDLAKTRKVQFLIKGLRNPQDFEQEFQMSLANYQLGKIETLFLMADQKHMHISSTLIREIGYFEGNLKDFVPAQIEPIVKERTRGGP